MTTGQPRDAWRRRVAQALIVVALIGLWQGLVTAGAFSAIAVASPASVARRLGTWLTTGAVWSDVYHTLVVLVIGYGAGVVVGTVVGFLMGVSAIVRAYLDPFVAFLNALPRLVLIPILIAWLGFGQTQQVVLVFLVVVFIVLINIQASVRGIPRELLDNARIIGANRVQLVQEVYLPAVGIWIISTARVAVGIGLQVAIVAEFFGGHRGLGYLIEYGEATLNTNLIYAAVAITVVLAVAIDHALGVLNRRVSRWLP